MRRILKIILWSIKRSGEILNKFKSKDFRASSLSAHDIHTLFTALPQNMINSSNFVRLVTRNALFLLL